MNYYYSIKYSLQDRHPLFGKRYKVIEPISICFRSEDGKSYSAIFKDLNPTLCSQWEQENILKQIIEDFVINLRDEDVDWHNYMIDKLDNKTISQQYKILQYYIGVKNEKICADLIKFTNPFFKFHKDAYNKSELEDPSTNLNKNFKIHNVTTINQAFYPQPTFISYNSSEHLVLETMFKKMPLGWPTYTVCAKEIANRISEERKINLNLYELMPKKPTHYSSINYSRYTKELFNFLNNIDGTTPR